MTDDIEIFVADEQSELVVDCQRWAVLARNALAAEKVRGPAELSLLFVDEETIAALAERFLGHHGPTDVLSFPIDDEPVPAGRNPDSGGTGPGLGPNEGSEMTRLLGDVVICPTVADRNAPEHIGPGHSGGFDDEIALLVVHGILHILGMDHEDPAEAEKMEAREQEILEAYHRPTTRGYVTPAAPEVVRPVQ